MNSTSKAPSVIDLAVIPDEPTKNSAVKISVSANLTPPTLA